MNLLFFNLSGKKKVSSRLITLRFIINAEPRGSGRNAYYPTGEFKVIINNEPYYIPYGRYLLNNPTDVEVPIESTFYFPSNQDRLDSQHDDWPKDFYITKDYEDCLENLTLGYKEYFGFSIIPSDHKDEIWKILDGNYNIMILTAYL